MTTYTNFTQVNLNMVYVIALNDLLNACKENGVEIEKVCFFQNGFIVIFEGIKGDAIIHDNSYGHLWGEWETIGMPWDYGDVTVHEPEELGKLLGALKHGEDWTKIGSDKDD